MTPSRPVLILSRNVVLQLLGIVLAMFVGLLCSLEGLYRYSLSAFPSLPTPPAQAPAPLVQQTLWVANGEAGPIVGEPFYPWGYMRRMHGPWPPGAKTADAVARAFSQRTRGRGTWATEETALMMWLTRNQSPEQLLGEQAALTDFGNGAIGWDDAAHRYFQKPPEQLQVHEVATLGVIAGGQVAADRVRKAEYVQIKRDWMIDQLRYRNAITAEQATEARALPVVLAE